MLGAAVLMKFGNRDDAYNAYAEHARSNGERIMSLSAFTEWWKGLKGLRRDQMIDRAGNPIDGTWVPVREALKASVNHLHTKGEAKMATTTTRKKSSTPTRRGPLKSAFLHDDPDVAFAAYKKMPHTKSPNARVMTKREFMKAYPERHAQAIAREQARNTQATQAEATTTGGQSIVDVLGESWNEADQSVIDALVNAGYTLPEDAEADDDTDAGTPDPTIIAALAHSTEALNAYLAQFQGGTTATVQRSASKRYKARTKRDDLPGHGDTYGEDENIVPASNAVLWALNTEGLLMTAYERASENGDVLGTDNAGDEPYITQGLGKALLAEVFGPLPERATA